MYNETCFGGSRRVEEGGVRGLYNPFESSKVKISDKAKQKKKKPEEIKR